jgi:hypothetical protein
VPSVIEDVVRDAAGAVAEAEDAEIVVNPPRHESECAVDYATHRASITELLRLAAKMATPPRSLHIVILPEAPPITRLYIRGAGIPTWVESIPAAHRAAFVAASAAITRASARLLRDAGGFLVLYGRFPDNEP